MTPDEILDLVASEMPTADEMQRCADTLRSSFDTLTTRREGFAMMRAAIEMALHIDGELIGGELGAGHERRTLIAAWLLRECDRDVAEAQRAVRRAKAKADAQAAALTRRGSA